MAMAIGDQLKCIVLLLPIVGAIILSAYLQDIYGFHSAWILLPMLILIPIAWKIFVKWAE